jgi:hypothetical protein
VQDVQGFICEYCLKGAQMGHKLGVKLGLDQTDLEEAFMVTFVNIGLNHSVS